MRAKTTLLAGAGIVAAAVLFNPLMALLLFCLLAALARPTPGVLGIYTIPQNNCDPRLILVDEANGSTLTRASIRAFTREDFEDQAMKEVGMDRIIAQTKEARMAGVKEKGLRDLLLSRHAPLKIGKGAPQGSIIAPYRLVPRRNIVNANYFQIEAGVATPGAGAGGIPKSAWDITVNVGTSPWVKSPSSALKNLEKFFLPGGYISIEYVDANKVARALVCRIVDATNADVGNVAKAVVTIEPNKTSSGDGNWWDAAAAGDKAIFQPTAGTVSLMHNSTSDYESQEFQLPAVNDLTLIDYWQQTLRWSFSYNEEYVKALESPLTSEFFKQFRSLPLAQQRKQQEQWLEAMEFNTFFFGDVINENQTVEGYQKLPLVTDPADPTYPIEFKSNTLGLRTQYGLCGRVGDKQGNPLDIDAIREICYTLKRYREGTSGTIDTIDSMTNRYDKARIRDIMIRFYKAKYNAELTMFAQLGQKLQFNGATVFEFDIYDLPDEGVKWAVFTDTFFDDKLAQFAPDQKNRGRGIWLSDWSDVQVNVMKTNSAKRTTNIADKIYRYVVTPNIYQTQLNSKTIEVQVGDANRGLIIENYSDACPKCTVQGCDLTVA